jgi:hypothetical protein
MTARLRIRTAEELFAPIDEEGEDRQDLLYVAALLGEEHVYCLVRDSAVDGHPYVFHSARNRSPLEILLDKELAWEEWCKKTHTRPRFVNARVMELEGYEKSYKGWLTRKRNGWAAKPAERLPKLASLPILENPADFGGLPIREVARLASRALAGIPADTEDIADDSIAAIREALGIKMSLCSSWSRPVKRVVGGD